MRLSRPITTWATTSIHSRGVSPWLMPRSNRSTCIGNLREQRIERLVENFEPRHLGIAQVDDDAGAIGGLDPRLAQRIAQPHRTRLADGVAPGILRV